MVRKYPVLSGRSYSDIPKARQPKPRRRRMFVVSRCPGRPPGRSRRERWVHHVLVFTRVCFSIALCCRRYGVDVVWSESSSWSYHFHRRREVRPSCDSRSTLRARVREGDLRRSPNMSGLLHAGPVDCISGPGGVRVPQMAVCHLGSSGPTTT